MRIPRVLFGVAALVALVVSIAFATSGVQDATAANVYRIAVSGSS